MFKHLFLVLLLLPIAEVVVAQPSPCPRVVADTVAELKAGGSGWWNDELEALVRTAAGSACVKALSGRYGPVQANQLTEEGVNTQSAGEAGSEVPESGAEEPLEFKPLSGSPTKKPFERRRMSDPA